MQREEKYLLFCALLCPHLLKNSLYFVHFLTVSTLQSHDPNIFFRSPSVCFCDKPNLIAFRFSKEKIFRDSPRAFRNVEMLGSADPAGQPPTAPSRGLRDSWPAPLLYGPTQRNLCSLLPLWLLSLSGRTLSKPLLTPNCLRTLRTCPRHPPPPPSLLFLLPKPPLILLLGWGPLCVCLVCRAWRTRTECCRRRPSQSGFGERSPTWGEVVGNFLFIEIFVQMCISSFS